MVMPNRDERRQSAVNGAKSIKDLHLAIKKNDLQDIQRLIDASASNELREELLAIALSISCRRGDIALVKHLLSKGANPNTHVTGHLPTLLRTVEACKGDDVYKDIIQLLLEHRADCGAVDYKQRTALMRAKTVDVAELLLAHGADLEARDSNGNTCLLNLLVEDQKTEIAETLIERGADIHATDGMQRTVLDAAVWRNRATIVDVLVAKGVDIGGTDDRQRTVWHHLAMDTEHRLEEDSRTSKQMLTTLLGAKGASDLLDARDSKKRTALHWAVSSGNILVSKSLLESSHVDVNATEHRSRTALYLAVRFAAEVETDLAALDQMPAMLSAEREGMAKDERPRQGSHLSASDTPRGPDTVNGERARRHQGKLLEQKESVERLKRNQVAILDLLLQHGAVNVNAEADDGWTPLHTVCASRVSLDPLNQLLARDVVLNKKTQTSKTAFHLACEAGNIDAVERLLAISTTQVDTKDNFGNTPLLGADACGHVSIVSLLAPWTKRHINSLSKEARGAAEKFRATVIDFGDYKRGKRPAKPSVFDVLYSDPTSEEPGKDTPPVIPRMNVDGAYRSNVVPPGQDQHRPDRMRRSSTGVSNGLAWPPKRSLTTDSQKSTRSDPNKLASAAPIDVRHSPSKAENNVFLFAPNLHFETDARRREMQKALDQAESACSGKCMGLPALAPAGEPQHEDELLLQAHLGSSTLHIRRTLDQFFYRTIDTAFRDANQVVYKHLEEQALIAEDLKVLMVDQLWLWILGDDLIITSFPQRWRQPPRDPLNVLDSVMEELNSRTEDGIGTVYELATLITGRCFETFDRSDIRPEGSRFLDMFESTIGKAMDDETELFRRFNLASKQLSIFLKDTKHWSSLREKEDAAVRKAMAELDHKVESPDGAGPANSDWEPQAIQALLDIDQEIKLWTKVKDVRDEMDMLRMVFEQQKQVLPGVRESMDIVLDSSKGVESEKAKIMKRIGYHERAIGHSIQEVDRMDKQAERIYDSIRNLLDLKQKHANAFEASYARIQAAETDRQGQTLMVFTIVTVIFLPLSFIAAFFALNVKEFPHQGDNQEMPLSYVSKWVFGIGVSIAIICVLAALSIDKLAVAFKTLREWILGIVRGQPRMEHHGLQGWEPITDIAAEPWRNGPTAGLNSRRRLWKSLRPVDRHRLNSQV
ncbi:hypothetical protein LTR85_004412 [Meristemomyces frigidus]|nr:hypothetical protein LTR85_004412 [Meristemomyces frigidus]